MRPGGRAPQFIPFGKKLQRAAMEWTYVVRNRRRWFQDPAARASQEARCAESLSGLGADPAAFLGVKVIEAEIPFDREEEGWEARVFPWEYVLSSVSRNGLERPATVYRRLVRPGNTCPRRPGTTVLIVDSAPAKARVFYDYEAECALVASCFPKASVRRIKDPSRDELAATLASFAPGIVHITGMDTHEAEAHGHLDSSKWKNGYLLRDGPVEAMDLADILNAGTVKPELVVFNIYYSASRIAAMAVARGAGASIGFQDEFDDDLALVLAAEFYENWLSTQRGAVEPFLCAWESLGSRYHGLNGSGWVLLTESSGWPETRPSAAGTQGVSQTPRRSLLPADLEACGLDIRDAVAVIARPLPRLNYALLHNGRDLFETFLIEKRHPGEIRGVNVEVSLALPDRIPPFETVVNLTEKTTDLKPRIRIPLFDSASRSLSEGVRTLLGVKVTWYGLVIHKISEFVTLLPPDEWTDDPGSWTLLPSFVLPRDPAIPRIVDRARPFLRALLDNRAAGFNGYQREDRDVDLEVQAIWSALSFEQDLFYSNPPPVYSVSSQRLRTPSHVMRTRTGTCLDLALLFAACLESVDINAVIFLFRGHACAGYWRSLTGYTDFRRLLTIPPEMTGELLLTGERYLEILGRVQHGDLCPVETTGLARQGSFQKARREGLENLSSSFEFETMIDIRQAREENILPLPLLDEARG